MEKFLMNRLANCGNSFQGKTKRVLCVCSAGLLRSPTAAEVLSREPFHYNTRAAGLCSEFALIPVDEVLLEWADEIVCMEESQIHTLQERVKASRTTIRDLKIICLMIEDSFPFRDPELQKMIKENYLRAAGIDTEVRTAGLAQREEV